MQKIKAHFRLKVFFVVFLVFSNLTFLTVPLVNEFKQINNAQAADYIYVSNQNGNDSNTGSLNSPKKTIQAAIDVATNPAEIRVAQGIYSVSSHIVIKSGVSLYGGYLSDFSSRNPGQFKTIINDTSTSGGYSGNPKHAVYFSGTISSSTVFDGFTINGGQGNYTACIFVDENAGGTISNNVLNSGDAYGRTYGIYMLDSASPDILNNQINAGDAIQKIVGDETVSFGIFASRSTATIKYNTIVGGETADGETYAIFGEDVTNLITNNYLYGGNCLFDQCYSCGIREDGAGPEGYGGSQSTIINNTIHGGTGFRTYGINVADWSDPNIYNNTITAGPAAWNATAILIKNDCNPRIINNIIYTKKGAAASFCIYENAPGTYRENSDSNPGILRNNNFFGCPKAMINVCIENSQGNCEQEIQVTSLNQSGPSTAEEGDGTLADWDNISEDISTSLDSELRFIGNLNNYTFDTAGLNGSYPGYVLGFQDDKDQNQRSPLGNTSPTGWSIGAYEYDDSTPRPYLTLTKTANTQPGQEITYTITCKNNSSLTATNITISDPIPTGTSFVVGSENPSGNYSDSQINWYVNQLRSGESQNFVFNVSVD